MFATVIGVVAFVAYVVGVILVWLYIVDNKGVNDAFDVLDDISKETNDSTSIQTGSIMSGLFEKPSRNVDFPDRFC